jgi:hypothetical protein
MRLKIVFPILTLVFITLSCQIIENKVTKTCINPPFEGINVPLTTYKINPTVANEINTEEGTRIRIPANILTDKSGNLITSPVELAYRPFHTTAEIIASGIPMRYDSLGQKFDFVSAGMFELRAKSNGNDVYIKDGEKIQVDFASFTNETGFNVYTLNEETGAWSFIEPNVATDNERKTENFQAFKDEFIIDLNLDYGNYPELEIFDQLDWVFAGENEAENPSHNLWIFDEKWRTISIERTDASQAIYTIHLGSKNKKHDLIVSPYLLGDETAFLAELDEGILKYNATVKSIKDEELKIQLQADFERSFAITNFGITNLDKINRLITQGQVFATNASFSITDYAANESTKIYLFSGNEKSMLMRQGKNWDKMVFKTNEKNSLMLVLPNNTVAICGNSEFEKAKGKTDHTFTFSKYEKIESLEDIEAIIASI